MICTPLSVNLFSWRPSSLSTGKRWRKTIAWTIMYIWLFLFIYWRWSKGCKGIILEFWPFCCPLLCIEIVFICFGPTLFFPSIILLRHQIVNQIIVYFYFLSILQTMASTLPYLSNYPPSTLTIFPLIIPRTMSLTS